MRRRLLVSLLVVSVASLASGAVWQTQADTDPLSALTNEQAVVLSQVMFDEDCMDLTDPYAPPNRLACELLCWAEYLLGKTCSEYVDCWMDCQGIPN